MKAYRVEKNEYTMISVFSGVCVLLLMVILTLSWTAMAQAQERGPSSNQYGPPAIIVTDGGTGDPTGTSGGTGGNTGIVGLLFDTSDPTGASGTNGGTPDSGVAGLLSTDSGGTPASGIVGIMPDTGGAQLIVLVGGVLLLGGGLAARRMVR